MGKTIAYKSRNAFLFKDDSSLGNVPIDQSEKMAPCYISTGLSKMGKERASGPVVPTSDDPEPEQSSRIQITCSHLIQPSMRGEVFQMTVFYSYIEGSQKSYEVDVCVYDLLKNLHIICVIHPASCF